MTRQRTSTLFLLLALTLFALAASASSALAGGGWKLTSLSDTAVAPGGTITYDVEVDYLNDTHSDGSQVKFTAILPAAFTATEVSLTTGDKPDFSCSVSPTGGNCEGPRIFVPGAPLTVQIEAQVDPAASGILTAQFAVEGGGAATAAQTVDPTRISDLEPGFGVDAFDGSIRDGAGNPLTAAGSHPSTLRTDVDFNIHSDPSVFLGSNLPFEDAKDVAVDLPPGLLGSVRGLGRCTPEELTSGPSPLTPQPSCPRSSQVGMAVVRVSDGEFANPFNQPVYNMVPSPNVAARFAFVILGQVVVLDTSVRSLPDGGYGLVVRSVDAPQGLTIAGTSVSLWGVPADPIHDAQRFCPGTGAPGCSADVEPRALLRTPTSCSSEAPEFDLRTDSWQHQGNFATASYRTHEAPGYPYPREEGPAGEMHRVWGPEVGVDGCGEVPFEPSLKVEPTTQAADSPTGLSVDLGLPSDCWESMATPQEVEESICQSDLKAAEVTLPEGMSLNPSAAGGREACSPAQVGLTSPIAGGNPVFDEAAVSCPDASKVGTVEIATPALDDPLKGSLYLAQQGQNPFGSLLAMYLVAEGSGVRIKQAGKISLDPKSGRLTTSFDNAPQTPFSNIHLDLYGGPRAALRTPAACGTYTTNATLTPWSGNGAVQRQSSFQVTTGCGGGFDPKLQAGTENPLAGTYSPFNLQLTRSDGMQEFKSLQVSLPPGLVGALKGYSYCPDATLAAISDALGSGRAQEASPSCPGSSFVGTATVGAGAGANPFYTSAGRAYLAGPYKGAPVSLAVVAPAVAGPFDLGSVVVRNAIHVDPTSAQLTIDSDPLPTILHGIPLDLRDIRIHYNQTLNPTSCEPFRVGSTVTSVQGATATPGVHFQAAGCDRLGFKPRLTLKLKGGMKRSDFPALTAVMRPRLGDANAGRLQVTLPHSEFLAESHLGTVCTRVQFAADDCPAKSIYGRVSATSPILDNPLTGKVYLRSSDHLLPDLVLALRGPANQPIEIDVVGRIDSDKRTHGLRTTFEGLPDAPLTKVVLKMRGGEKSLLENSIDICRHPQRASAAMVGQNGKLREFRPKLRVHCGKRK